MAGEKVVIHVPDPCDDCPAVKAVFDKANEPGFNPNQVRAIEKLFSECPGYKTGFRGAVRTVIRQFRESFENGGVAHDMDNKGRLVQLETFDESIVRGCGASVRKFVEIEGMRKGGFETTEIAYQSRITGEATHPSIQ